MTVRPAWSCLGARVRGVEGANARLTLRMRGWSAGGGYLGGEVFLALVVGDDGGDGDLLVGGDGGGGLGAGEDLFGAVGVLDVPVDIRDRAVGVGGCRGVQGDLVAVAGEGEGAGGAHVVHLCLRGGGLFLSGLLVVQGVHDGGGHGLVAVGVGMEASGVEQTLEPGGTFATQLVSGEGVGGVGELVAVAQGGGFEGGVELIGAGVDPALVHFGESLAAAGYGTALAARRSEHARVADGDDGRARGAGGDVGHDRVVAVDTGLLPLAGQGVDGRVDRVGEFLVAAAVGERGLGDALGEDLGEAGVVAADGKGDQAGGGVQVIELGRFLPRGAGLVEVLGPGAGAGAEVERLAGPLGDLVGVGCRGALALVTVLHLHVGALGIGGSADAGGIGIPEGHVVARRQGRGQRC